MSIKELLEDQEAELCEQMTGCDGAGDYRKYAEMQGYSHCGVIDWTSSAGDWTFLVSKDRKTWYVMSQENNWPNVGFTRSIEDRPMFSTQEELTTDEALEIACEIISELYG